MSDKGRASEVEGQEIDNTPDEFPEGDLDSAASPNGGQ